MNLQELITKIEKYHFQCEAGNLVDCIHWLALKKRLKAIENAHLITKNAAEFSDMMANIFASEGLIDEKHIPS